MGANKQKQSEEKNIKKYLQIGLVKGEKPTVQNETKKIIGKKRKKK